MKKKIFWHALNCLAHPISVLALLVVGVNALVLQVYWPSWWTGKLGDAAWMVFSPFLLVSAVIWFLPREWSNRSHKIFSLSLSVVCVSFIMAKSVPAVNFAIHSIVHSLGLPIKLALDSTDLIVLPLALVSRQIWNKEFVVTPYRSRVLAVLVLALFVTVADMASPPSNCLFLMKDNSIIAKAVYSYYRSDDGGITWVQDATKDDLYCSYMTWPVSLDTNPPLTFYYSRPEGLYQSLDQGKTLTRVHVRQGGKTLVEYAVATPYDTLVIAMGNGGFATRLPDGKWLQYQEISEDLLLKQITE